MNTPRPVRGVLQAVTPEQLAVETQIAALPECCAKCRFFCVVQDAKSGSPVVTICRRYPPVITLVAMPMPQRGVLAGPGQPMMFANEPLWSQVQASDWCGEFASRPTPVNSHSS